MAKEYFFTFGSNHLSRRGASLGYRFVKIPAGSQEEAQEIMYRARGEKWAFCYSADEFKGQPEKYGLSEIDIYDAAFMRI